MDFPLRCFGRCRERFEWFANRRGYNLSMFIEACIGRLFRRIVTQTVKTELLIFLTPQVAKEAQALKGISEGEQRRSQLVPGAVSPATYGEHMEGMQGGPPPPEKKKP